MSSSGGTLKPDICHIIVRPEIGMCSAVKISTRVLAKNGSHSAAQEQLPAQQKEAQFVRGERVHAAFPQGQYRALIF